VRIIKSFKLIISIVFIFAILLIIACSDGTNPADKKFVLPEKDLSFYDHIEPLFNVRCGMESGCHSPTDISNPLLYNDLVSRNGLVYHQLSSTGEQLISVEIDSLNPQSSVLFRILYEGYPDEYYDQMPPPATKDPLNSNQLNGIKQWIREGAPE
jgi:hypothetical protein